MVRLFHRVVLAAGVIVAGCSATPWNNPYPARDAGTNTLYSSFAERPRHLDPVQSYASNEYQLIANIYQPPLQYHYLKRPFELIPFAATAVPKPEFYDAAGRRYCMTYATVGVPRLTQVLVETDAGGGWGDCGAETEVARVDYAYYTDDADDHGMAGDLKLATVTMPLSEFGPSKLRKLENSK